MQQYVGLEQNKHLIERLVRVAYPNAVVDIRSAGRDDPALGDGDAEIGGFILFGLHGLCRRFGDLDSALGFGLCAVIVDGGFIAAGGKRYCSGKNNGKKSACLNKLFHGFSSV